MEQDLSQSDKSSAQSVQSHDTFSDFSCSYEETPQIGKNLTYYPISRLQAFRMFKQPIQYRTQRTFPSYGCVGIVKDSLEEMASYGYHFQSKYARNLFRRNQHRQSMRRKVKARFRCDRCAKHFTSILGTFQIAFQVHFKSSCGFKISKQSSTKNNKKNHLHFSVEPEIQNVNFRFRLYKMKCETCNQFCHGVIYESQLIAVAKSFCVVLAQIFDGIERPKHRDDRNKQNEDMHNHRADLCQACQKNVCFNRDKGTADSNKINENTKQVYHQSDDGEAEAEREADKHDDKKLSKRKYQRHKREDQTRNRKRNYQKIHYESQQIKAEEQKKGRYRNQRKRQNRK